MTGARWWESEDDTGATAVEYALFVALIAAVIITIVATIGQQALAIFSNPELLDAFTT